MVTWTVVPDSAGVSLGLPVSAGAEGVEVSVSVTGQTVVDS